MLSPFEIADLQWMSSLSAISAMNSELVGFPLYVSIV